MTRLTPTGRWRRAARGLRLQALTRATARRLAGERGSLTLGLPLFVTILFMVAAILFRVGFVADLRAGTQTAADAAALAAAQTVGEEIVELIAELVAEAEELDAEPPPIDLEELCELIDGGAVEAAAEDYAGRNGANVTEFAHDCMEVEVSVQSDGGVPGVAGLTEESGPAVADATAVVEIPDLPGPDADLEELVEFLEAGVDLDVRLVE